MKRLILSTIIAASATLTACVGLPPSAAEIAKTPHIRFGQPFPEGDNYVLHFPAGTPLPVSTVVDGNLFEQDSQATLHVTLKRDVYMYRQFASFDGQNWQPARKLMETRLELQIPQKDGSNAGMLHVRMDQK
ncbi:MAG: hypothetical protein A2V79_00440 [Betaproteobacteria bacterium RBG_16_56_24]|nr:MAG: hypothetical protein A2V79_00440 [Betaproteobacteria bacterium RBG_16_56_24]